jgi:penicillin-binding protein 1A
VKEAFLAAEDAEFFKHGPLDLWGILRAAWINLKYGRVLQGGSTITQQVIKTMVLGSERSLLRKIKEAVLAYRLERYLSKDEILHVYLNVVYMGHGLFGIEAASQFYFGKHANELTKAEAALLAGIVQAPQRYSPKLHPGLARMRQKYVVEQMLRKGFIREREKEAILRQRLFVRKDGGLLEEDYFKDYIVRYVEAKYGRGIFQKRSLRIYATVDPALQRWAAEAIRRGLWKYEQRRGDYVICEHLPRSKWAAFRESQEKDLAVTGVARGEIYYLLLTERMRKGYRAFLGYHDAYLEVDTFPFRPGDVAKGIYVGKRKGLMVFLPVKTKNVEGALVAMDVKRGYVLALVGGRDFKNSPFNRCFSSNIQPGSAFKPFVYLAALKKGYTPDSVVLDLPKTYRGGLQGSWTPRNYDGQYDGEISLKDALAFSKNAATVRLLEDVGIEGLLRTVREVGLEANVPRNLAAALGGLNLSLFELTKGFTVFASGGLKVKPVFVRKIVDQKGRVIEENWPSKERVIDERIAVMMDVLLRASVEYGTAKAASVLGATISGKTGTTDGYCDALFVGYSKEICVGVWVGFDKRQSLGEKESGARVALPIWIDFMAFALKRYPPTEAPYDDSLTDAEPFKDFVY